MQLLDSVARLARSYPFPITKWCKHTPSLAQKSHCGDPDFSTTLCCLDKVLGVAGGGQEEAKVACFPKCLHSSGKDHIIAIIVGCATHVSRICEGQYGVRNSVISEPAGPFFGKVHGIGQTASIPTNENFVSRFERVNEKFAEAIERVESCGIGPNLRQELGSFIKRLCK